MRHNVSRERHHKRATGQRKAVMCCDGSRKRHDGESTTSQGQGVMCYAESRMRHHRPIRYMLVLWRVIVELSDGRKVVVESKEVLAPEW